MVSAQVSNGAKVHPISGIKLSMFQVSRMTLFRYHERPLPGITDRHFQVSRTTTFRYHERIRSASGLSDQPHSWAFHQKPVEWQRDVPAGYIPDWQKHSSGQLPNFPDRQLYCPAQSRSQQQQSSGADKKNFDTNGHCRFLGFRAGPSQRRRV